MKAFIQRSAQDDLFGGDQLDAILLSQELAGDGRSELGSEEGTLY